MKCFSGSSQHIFCRMRFLREADKMPNISAFIFLTILTSMKSNLSSQPWQPPKLWNQFRKSHMQKSQYHLKLIFWTNLPIPNETAYVFKFNELISAKEYTLHIYIQTSLQCTEQCLQHSRYSINICWLTQIIILKCQQ